MGKYTLMNKDTEVVHFSISRNKSGNTMFFDSEVKSALPVGMKGFREWMESRYAMESRVNTTDFFRSLGISCLEDFICTTNCVSLLDSFWVKKRDAALNWKEVSLYRHSLNTAISDYSFSGIISGKIECSPSPDFATDGNFLKCWIRENGQFSLCKAGSSGAANAGNEPYSEVYASKIAKRLGINCVDYTLADYRGKLISKCRCMCDEKYGFKAYNSQSGVHEANFKTLLDDLGTPKYILDMLLLDYVTCNVDRHYGNFGFIIDNDTQKLVSFAPLYDHNLSCLPYYTEDENLEYYMNDILAKDGSGFCELYDCIACSYTREKLYNLIDFDVSIGCKRDHIVNEMVRYQVERVLK